MKSIKQLFNNSAFAVLIMLVYMVGVAWAADTKLSALTELAAAPAESDELYINDGGTSKKIQVINAMKALESALTSFAIHADNLPTAGDVDWSGLTTFTTSYDSDGDGSLTDEPWWTSVMDDTPTVVYATVDPSPTDDINASPTAATPDVSGYDDGDLWINRTHDRVWTIVDTTDGAAVWELLTNTVYSLAELRDIPVATPIDGESVILVYNDGTNNLHIVYMWDDDGTGADDGLNTLRPDDYSTGGTWIATGLGAVKTLSLTDDGSLQLDAGADSMDDDEYNGVVLYGKAAGEDVAQWGTVFLQSDAKFDNADANAAGEFPALGIAVGCSGGGDWPCQDTETMEVMVRGVIRNEDWTGLTIGSPVYLSETAGGVIQTAPSDSGDAVQIVGWALSDSEIYFDFSRPYVEVE